MMRNRVYYIHKKDFDSRKFIKAKHFITGELFRLIAMWFKPAKKDCKCDRVRAKMNTIGPFVTLFSLKYLQRDILMSSGWDVKWKPLIKAALIFVCIFEILTRPIFLIYMYIHEKFFQPYYLKNYYPEIYASNLEIQRTKPSLESPVQHNPSSS